MIGIIDYGMGNLYSVLNAVEFLGYEAKFLKSKHDFSDEFSHFILPGVGSYSKAMQNIKNLGFDSCIKNIAKEEHPILGICLGMQLLSTTGTEPEITQGLNLISGEVIPLAVEPLKLPHVGWNSIIAHKEHPVFKNIKKTTDFYFVHSYHFSSVPEESVICTTEYGKVFNSVIGNKNIIATQFHPEKSQDVGLKLLENFLNWDGKC